MQTYDIMIIGGGILAYSTALSILIKEPHADIAIISGQTTEGGATTAAGAMLGCFGEVTKNLLKSAPGKIKHSMAIQAKRMWAPWLNSINECLHDLSLSHDDMDINLGTFVILNAKSGKLDDDNFSAILQALDDYDEPYASVDYKQIPGFNPLEDCRPLKSIYIPNEGAIDPNHLLSSLKKIIALKKNCTLLFEDAIKIHTHSNRISFVETNQGKSLEANKILLAAGAYSQELINQIPHLRYHIPPTFSGVGVSILVDQSRPPINATIRTPNRAGACGLHVLPKGSDYLYVGATNNLYMKPSCQPKLGPMNFLLQCTLEQINQNLFNANIISYSVGNRPASFDTFPLIGKTSIEDFWILGGTYRDGFFLSPVLSDIVASEMVGRDPTVSVQYDIFTPERSPIQSMTKPESILDTIQQYTSGTYEHDIKLPRMGWHAMLEEMIYTKVTNLYQKLETDITIPGEIILMLDEEKNLAFLKDYLNNISNVSKQKNSTLLVGDNSIDKRYA